MLTTLEELSIILNIPQRDLYISSNNNICLFTNNKVNIYEDANEVIKLLSKKLGTKISDVSLVDINRIQIKIVRRM